MGKNAVCFHCVYAGTEDLEEGKLCCLAYPDGVPHEIMNGEDNHTSLRGDEFEPIVFTKHIEPGINVSYENRYSIGDMYGDCINCVHWNATHDSCPAFDKIPYQLIRTIGHNKVFDGQNQSSVKFQRINK